MSDEKRPSVGADPAPASFGPAPARAVRVSIVRPVVSGFATASGVVLAVVLALAVVRITSVLAAIALAAFFALGLAPAVQSMMRRGVSQRWAVVAVSGAFLLLSTALIVVVLPATVRQLVRAVQRAPQGLADVAASSWFTSVEQALGVDGEALLESATGTITSPESLLLISGGLLRVSFGAVSVLSSLGLVLVLTIYFLASLSSILKAASSLVPAYRRHRFTTMATEIVTTVGRTIAGGVTLSALNAAFVFLLQLLISSPWPALLAVTAFCITLVPMIGSVVFLVVGTLGALFVSPTSALVFGLTYFIYIQIEAYQLTPRIMGRVADIPAVIVILGAMTGASLMGLLGALLAIPITASLLIVLRKVTVPKMAAQTAPP